MRNADEPSHVPIDAPAPPPPNDNTGVTPPAAGGWVGVRKPTPEELKQYAQSNGWSEDFVRYDDATLSQWIADRWDVGRNKFRSYHAPQDAGDWAYVEKPSESVVDPSTGTEWGPWGNQDAVNVTEQKARAAAAPAPTPTPATPTTPAATTPTPTTPNNDLQQQLIDMFTKGGGYFAEHPGALSLAGGGIVWKDPTETGGTSGPQTGGPDPVPTNLYPQTGGPDPSTPQTGGPDPVPTNLYGAPSAAFASSATTPTTPGVNPSLAKATLNAFAPMGAGGVAAGVQPAGSSGVSTGVQPATIPRISQPAAPPAVPQLQDQLSRMFANPAQWWKAQNPRMTR